MSKDEIEKKNTKWPKTKKKINNQKNEDQIRNKKKIRGDLIFLDWRMQLKRKFNFTKGSKTKNVN
jgi:hypothetical protein